MAFALKKLCLNFTKYGVGWIWLPCWQHLFLAYVHHNFERGTLFLPVWAEALRRLE
jgi:hypothetical protein